MMENRRDRRLRAVTIVHYTEEAARMATCHPDRLIPVAVTGSPDCLPMVATYHIRGPAQPYTITDGWGRLAVEVRGPGELLRDRS